MTVLTKNQKKMFRKDYMRSGKPETMIVEVRYDDECGNGHNTFAITAEIYQTQRYPGEKTIIHEKGGPLWLNSCGCLHDEIAKRFPELHHLIKFHLCSSDGPIHYIANTLYHAGDKDHNGLRVGERRQLRDRKTGILAWKLQDLPTEKYVDADTKPEPITLEWEPWETIGEGKERELNSARTSACWPEATDEELCSPDLKEKLEARLPALLESFQAAVEGLGFVF